MTLMTRRAALHWWGHNRVPDDVAYFYHDGGYCFPGVKPDWKIVTYSDLREKRIQIMNNSLEFKRQSEKIIPAYAWVFYNDTDFFGGWWLYIQAHNQSWCLNHRQPRPDLVKKVMSSFPCGVMPIQDNFDIWAANFSKQFKFSGWGGRKKQGIHLIKIKIEGKKLIDII